MTSERVRDCTSSHQSSRTYNNNLSSGHSFYSASIP